MGSSINAEEHLLIQRNTWHRIREIQIQRNMCFKIKGIMSLNNKNTCFKIKEIHMTISEKHLLAAHVQDDRLIYQGWRTPADSHKKLGKLPIKDLQTFNPIRQGSKVISKLNLLKSSSLPEKERVCLSKLDLWCDVNMKQLPKLEQY